jgi:hypothetical protein
VVPRFHTRGNTSRTVPGIVPGANNNNGERRISGGAKIELLGSHRRPLLSPTTNDCSQAQRALASAELVQHQLAPAHWRRTGAMPMRMKWHSTDDGKRTVVGGGYLPSTPTVDGFKFTKCRSDAARCETDDSDWFANHYASGAMTLVSTSFGSNLGR